MQQTISTIENMPLGATGYRNSSTWSGHPAPDAPEDLPEAVPAGSGKERIAPEIPVPRTEENEVQPDGTVPDEIAPLQEDESKEPLQNQENNSLQLRYYSFRYPSRSSTRMFCAFRGKRFF
ncbi:hypothetical protein [Niabella sp.]|uniref:hypothetical protein n=1 Tax=Niabella sp. TaxID=1962976 RepID=UPI002634C03B|nr:hypothetical protein [Niabella sp.]